MRYFKVCVAVAVLAGCTYQEAPATEVSTIPDTSVVELTAPSTSVQAALNAGDGQQILVYAWGGVNLAQRLTICIDYRIDPQIAVTIITADAGSYWGPSTESDVLRFFDTVCTGLQTVGDAWIGLPDFDQTVICDGVDLHGAGDAADFLMTPPDAFAWGVTTRDDLVVFFSEVCASL